MLEMIEKSSSIYFNHFHVSETIGIILDVMAESKNYAKKSDKLSI